MVGFFNAIKASRVRVGPKVAECPYRLLSLAENKPASAGRSPNGLGWSRSVVTSLAAKTLLSHTSHPGQPRHRSFHDRPEHTDPITLRGWVETLCIFRNEVASKPMASTFHDDGAAHAEAPPSTNGTGPVVAASVQFPSISSGHQSTVLTALAPQTSPPTKSNLIRF